MIFPVGERRGFSREEHVMSDKRKAEEAEAKKVLANLFEGVKGRQPKTDEELNEWLASPEGKAATAFEATSLSRWGEHARS
jgi:hypothetical protein